MQTDASLKLTKNQKLVWEKLSTSENPLSAYTILDALREQGFRAPLQVYRALDGLMELGLVHRLESLNAFIACSHPECETHEATAFMICDSCKCVIEFNDTHTIEHIKNIASNEKFQLQHTTIELRGECNDCRS